MEMEIETESRDEHRFHRLKDAVTSINQKVCLIGVIFEFSLPKKSKGSDYFCTVKVIDESYTKPGISVNFFAPVVEKLPRVASPGDIIVLSDVVMKTHNAGVYAYFNKKFSSFGLYEGKHGQDFSPYQCSPTFCPHHVDSAFISTLRDWLSHFQLSEDSNSFLFLREVKEGECGNIICKILHVCETSENEWMIFVWDGTDTPPASLNTKLEEELNKQLPLQLEPSPLPKDILCTFPTVGTVLRVVIGKDSENILHLLSTGKWMNFINIVFEVLAGLWCGVVTPFTKIHYLPNENNLMAARQRSYDERLSLKLGRIPYSSFPWCSEITEVDYDHVPFVTLMDVLTYSEVTAIFKCIVRVVAAIPWQAENFCSQSGTYRVRLTIEEDPTARIHAFLFAEDGEKFFDGYPSIDALTRKRNKMLAIVVDDDGNEVENTARNPPWIRCCLKSYYLDKNDIWGSRHYRIFGTTHLG